MAMAVYERLAPVAAHLQRPIQVALLPTARSPFKQNSTEARQRLAMLSLATHITPIDVCTDELWQDPPVYTIDTVKALRDQHPDDSLIFIMGADSAATLTSWKQGLELTDFVDLWVFERHSDEQEPLGQQCQAEAFDLPAALPESLQPQVTNDPLDLLADRHDDLKAQPRGRIYIDKTDIMAISSSDVRDALAADDASTLEYALPPIVYDYIREQGLYCHPDAPRD